MVRRRRQVRTKDDDGESLYRKQGRGVVAAEEISIAFPEIEQERGLIEFWLELVLSIVDAMVSLSCVSSIIYLSLPVSIKMKTPMGHTQPRLAGMVSSRLLARSLPDSTVYTCGSRAQIR